MSFRFEWNPYADQPHNVAARKERLRHHFKHAGSYMSLAAANFRKLIPALRLYRRYWRNIYKQPVDMQDAVGLSVSPAGERNGDIIDCLEETGVRHSLVRIPSWERRNLAGHEAFIRLLKERDIDLTIALLQRREDVLRPSGWTAFLKEVFSRFSRFCSYFEVGHAWNRTKWGVWDHEEYLRLARPAAALAERFGVKLVGPAVIDFEFHLYPPVLQAVPFDKVSSLLYVDRTGPPENSQFGWTTARKAALLKAVTDACSPPGTGCWITEVNWPLAGTGRYSPAAGKPMVSEEEQADYLVRYYVLCLASGFIERVYWWQLVAPGYGLIDSRGNTWRKRPAYHAFKVMVGRLEGSRFERKDPGKDAEIFFFRREDESFALCWTKGPVRWRSFGGKVKRVVDRDGRDIPFDPDKIIIDGRPKCVYFKEGENGQGLP